MTNDLVMWVCDICSAPNSRSARICSEAAAHPVPVGDVIRFSQQLPAEFASELQRLKRADPAVFRATLAAARGIGWTLEALASPFGLSRERIRQLVKEAKVCDLVPAIPPLPRKSPQPAAPQDYRLYPRPEVADRLRRMQDVAKRVNGGTPAGHPSRAISVEYSALLHELVELGVTVCTLAKAAGVYHNAICMRLARHGYREPMPSHSGERYLGRPTPSPGKPKVTTTREHAQSNGEQQDGGL